MTWESQPIPGGWKFTNEDHNADIILDYIYPTARGLEAWVERRIEGQDIPLSSGQRNLMIADAIGPFAKQASAHESKIPWEEGLRYAFYITIEAWREGAATLDLATIEPADLVFMLDPLVEEGGNTRLIAPGGSGKSIFAMAIALSVATDNHQFLGLHPQKTGPVFYCDWEANADEHARRARALCNTIDAPPLERDQLIYQFQSLPLHQTVQRIRRDVDRSEAVMLIVDSSKMAAGPSSQASGEDSTLKMFAALREIGRPAVIVDHKTKEDIRRDRRGGYGSVFNENLARLEWEYIRYSQPAKNERHFVLSLEKENNVGDLPPLGFKLITDGGKTGITKAAFTRVSPDTITDPSLEDLGERVMTLFHTSTEPMVLSRMAEILAVSEGSLRARLNKDHRFFNVNEGKKGKKGLWRPADDFVEGPRDDGIQDDLGGAVSDWREGDEVF